MTSFLKFLRGNLLLGYKLATTLIENIFCFRFLKPSQVKGVDTDAFLRNQHLSMHVHENSVLGYRGLLGKIRTPLYE